MASKRLMKENSDLIHDTPTNFAVTPNVRGDLHHWRAVMTWPDGSPYDGGNFTLDIRCPEQYPSQPPAVRFETPIYHPNVDKEGNCSFDLLKETKWNDRHTIAQLLRAILLLMSKPQLDNAVAVDVAKVYQTDKKKYAATATEWTRKYAASG